MKIAVSTSGEDLSSQVEPRFGRCPKFLIVDTETMNFEIIPNEARDTAHGAGVGAARIVVSKGVDAVLTGNVGPNAYSALTASNIQVFTRVSGSIKEALIRLFKNELKPASKPSVDGHFGKGAGRGRRREKRGISDFSKIASD